jgi:biotin operon repressor
MNPIFKPKGTPWTMTEVKFLRENYPDVHVSKLADQLGRSRKSVKSAASNFNIKKNEDSDDHLVQHGTFKMERLLKLIKALHEKPMSIPKIMEALEISNRTAYRYIGLLDTVGVKVIRIGKRYSLDKSACPLCGHTTNNTL